VAHNHFKALFSEDEEVNPKFVVAMLQGIPRLVRDEENKELGKEINEDGVIDVIGSLDLDKALGLDGFSIHSFNLEDYHIIYICCMLN
jgi:hypothetical protein